MLNERHALFSKALPDGRVVDVYPLTFSRARITISESADAGGFTDGW